MRSLGQGVWFSRGGDIGAGNSFLSVWIFHSVSESASGSCEGSPPPIPWGNDELGYVDSLECECFRATLRLVRSVRAGWSAGWVLAGSARSGLSGLVGD